MSMYDRIRQLERQRTVILQLAVTDMITIEDYNVIVQELKKHNGIKEIGPLTNNNVLRITYSPSTLSLYTIIYLIGKLGYRQNIKKKNIYKPQSRKKGG